MELKTKKDYYLINEAAKEVQVEAHVLRYWEEELGLPIKRNTKGHRVYTEEDVLQFIKIKKLKEEGLQLKAVKRLLKDASTSTENKLSADHEKDEMKVINFQVKKDDMEATEKDRVSDIIAGLQEERRENKEEKKESPIKIEIKEVHMEDKNIKNNIMDIGLDETKQIKLMQNLQVIQNEKREKLMRIQALLRHMINDSIQLQQTEIVNEIKENMAKEFDYQFRQFEEQQLEMEKRRIEREEKRETEQKDREEKHFKRIDELLRNASTRGKRKKLS